MILQNIVFPIEQQFDVAELYYRANEDIKVLGNEEIYLYPYSKLNLCTFFNAFSANKWHKYTLVQEVMLNVVVSGSGIIRLMKKSTIGDICVCEQSLSSTVQEYLEIRFVPTSGFYYMEVEALDECLHLHRAYFSAEGFQIQPVELAIAICTFHREEYVRRNISQIREKIYENEKSLLKSHMDIYIVDNGKTLSESEFSISQIRVIPNENTGGSGGFTRGLIEVLHEKVQKQYTHIILMDDDIQLDTEVLERTYSFLSCLKHEFQNTVLGGIMLHNENPCFWQPTWNNWRGTIASNECKFNLGQLDNLEKFDAMSGGEYQPWWYCCLPLSAIGRDNLPLPFFIHGDDVEYGLRNRWEILQLNGICVWHDSFENKRPSHLEYYDTRNYLIINSIYNKERFSLVRQILNCLKRSTALIFRMRYKDVQLITLGISDFLKGPKWWSEQNIAALHQQVMSLGYRYEELRDVKSTYEKMTDGLGKSLNPWKYIVTLNGAFFPKNKEPIMVPCGSSPFLLFRRKSAYLLDAEKKKAVYVEFSLKKFLKSYAVLLWTFLRLVLHYGVINRQYQDTYREIGTEKFWEQKF